MEGEGDAAHAGIAAVARESYGRLVAYLAARSGDVAGAEDALGDAFLAALQQWPKEGLPEKPEAWLLTAAKRRVIDAGRREQVRAKALEQLMLAAEPELGESPEIPDERLKLLFVCAHPAIDRAIRTPLMLQTVLGCDAATIAATFLSSPTAMSQRLVRAKTKIREAGIPFLVPERAQFAERLESVLEAIYAAYTTGWERSAEASRNGLAAEAVWLARVMQRLMPLEPEVLGLLALLLFCESRRAARINASGGFVPLPEQEVGRWDRAMIQEGEALLWRAATRKVMGRFQLEAAIQSVHCERLISGVTDWRAIRQLYDGLLRVSPSIGGQIGHAVAVSELEGSNAGLVLLEALPRSAVTQHQPFWAAYAHLSAQTGETEQAKAAYRRAIELSDDSANREFLRKRLLTLG